MSNVGNKTPRAAGSKRATSRRTQLAFRTPSFAVAFECVQPSQLKVPAAADKQFRATRRPREAACSGELIRVRHLLKSSEQSREHMPSRSTWKRAPTAVRKRDEKKKRQCHGCQTNATMSKRFERLYIGILISKRQLEK